MSIKTDTEQIPPKRTKSPPKSIESPQRKKRKLTWEDMESIARLLVECKLTETEAAQQLGFTQAQYFCFKNRQRNKDKFADILTRIRGAQITNAIQKIRACGDGIEGTMKPDWRAHAFILERVLASDRFSQKVPEAEQKSPIFAVISSDVAASVFQKLLPEPEKMKQLPQVVDIEANKE